MEVLGQAVSFHFQINIADYTEQVFCSGMKIILPFLALCLFCSALPSILQTGFVLATKIPFGRYEPVRTYLPRS